MKAFGVSNLDNPITVHGDELVGGLDNSQGENGREVDLNFVDDGLNVRVPDADFVIEACTEQQNHALVEGQRHNPTCVFLVSPLLLVVDGVPQDQLAIHPPPSHKLQLRHGDHTRNHLINLLLISLLILQTGLALLQRLLQVRLQVPHVNVAAFLPTV